MELELLGYALVVVGFLGMVESLTVRKVRRGRDYVRCSDTLPWRRVRG